MVQITEVEISALKIFDFLDLSAFGFQLLLRRPKILIFDPWWNLGFQQSFQAKGVVKILNSLFHSSSLGSFRVEFELQEFLIDTLLWNPSFWPSIQN